MDVYYNIQDLLAVRWIDDTAMPLFLQRWDSVTDGMGPEFIQDRLLRDLFLEQVSRSKVLAEDVAHYHRLKPEDENKTLDFLRDAVERSIKLSEDKAVVTERQNNWRSNATAAISTTETPKAAAKPPKDKKTGVAPTSKTPDRPKQGEKHSPASFITRSTTPKVWDVPRARTCVVTRTSLCPGQSSSR